MVLDAHPDGIIYRDLIPNYVKFVRTIYEGLKQLSEPSLILFILYLLDCRLIHMNDKLNLFCLCLSLDDLGTTAVDVNYLNVGGAGEPDYQLFIC